MEVVKLNKPLWEQILKKYGDDGSGQPPKELRVDAFTEYKKLGGTVKVVVPKRAK